MAKIDETWDKKTLTNREFRALPIGKKVEYMWKYKRIHLIMYAVELALIIAGLLFLQAGNKNRLTGIILNNADSAPVEMFETLKADFQEAARKYSKKTKVEVVGGLNYYLNDESKVEENYGLIRFLVENIKKGDLDFLTGDQETVEMLAYSGFFRDLSVVLSKEQVERYKPYFRYIDQAVVDQIILVAESETDVDIQLPDCAKPEEMEKPIPVMIDVSHYDNLKGLYAETTGTVVFTICEDSPEIGGLRNILDVIFE